MKIKIWFYWDVYAHCKGILYFSKGISVNTFPITWFKVLAVCLALSWVLYRSHGFGSQFRLQSTKSITPFYFLQTNLKIFFSYPTRMTENFTSVILWALPTQEANVLGAKVLGPLAWVPCAHRLPRKLPCSSWQGLSDAVAHSLFGGTPHGAQTLLPRQGIQLEPHTPAAIFSWVTQGNRT